NRAGEFGTYRNLMITMLLGGLWHGAAWTFVAWGALHGVFLVGHRLLARPERPTGQPTPFQWRRDLLRTLGTFHLVCLAWVFFRATSFSQAFHYLAGILTLRGGPVDANALVTLAVLGALMLAI